MLSGFQRYLQLLVVAAVLYAGWTFLSRSISSRRWAQRRDQVDQAQQLRNAEYARLYGGSEVKILQFYARDGNLTEGNNSVICYGVLNAQSVRIDPQVEGVSVSPNRCVEVAPLHDTQYTLTAQGTGGQTVSASFLLKVSPDVATLPRITSFRIEEHKPDYRGREVYLLSFAAQNAELVNIDPQAFPTLHGSPNGRFYVAPEKTTTYTLTVTGKRGRKVRQELTVPVAAR